jgi:hypothetical protein
MQRTTGEPIGAQTVQDRSVETRQCCEPRIGMQWIAIAGEPVDERLISACAVGDRMISATIRSGVAIAGRAAVATPAALTTDEDGTANSEQRIAGGIVDAVTFEGHHGAGTLVVDTGDATGGSERTLNRDLTVLHE